MAKPLEGIRILEIGGYISLPLGTSLLAQLGAEVVKAERPVVGEDFRRQDNEKSPYFRQYNYGKRSLSVDLKAPEGVELVKKLLPNFDVVLENMRPGKIEALGLGEAACREVNPDIIFGSVTGFGNDGPMAKRPAYDTIGHAFGGLYSIWSDKDRPQLAGGVSADVITGLVSATGVLAALIDRERNGSRPRRVDTSIVEAVSVLTVDSITQLFERGEDPVRNSRHPQAQNFALRTSDDKALAIHLSSSQKFWKALCDAMDRPDLAEDPRFAEYRPREANYFALVPLVEEHFKTQEYAYWENKLTEHDVPFAPIHSISGYLQSEQVRHLGISEEQEDGLHLVRAPWRFDGARPEREGRAPRVGADSDDIASEVLSKAELEALHEAGVIFIDAGADEFVS